MMHLKSKEEILDAILAAKPKSIHDCINEEFISKYDRSDYVWSGNCFEWYWAVGQALQPKTFMEIGVRFGFSFLPTIQASDAMEYALGWDVEEYGDNKLATINIETHYKGNCKWELQHVDSQLMDKLPQFFDFVSIDGCHEYDCKIHDLKLCINSCHFVLLDDYDYHKVVRDATDYFLENYREHIEWNEYIPTFRGSQLIKFKHNP